MDKKKLLTIIEEEFFKGLESQTSWGKEQVKKKFLEIKGKVLLDQLEKEKL